MMKKGPDHGRIMPPWNSLYSTACLSCMFGLSYIERPILGDNPKGHKVASSGRLPFSVTKA